MDAPGSARLRSLLHGGSAAVAAAVLTLPIWVLGAIVWGSFISALATGLDVSESGAVVPPRTPTEQAAGVGVVIMQVVVVVLWLLRFGADLAVVILVIRDLRRRQGVVGRQVALLITTIATGFLGWILLAPILLVLLVPTAERLALMQVLTFPFLAAMISAWMLWILAIPLRLTQLILGILDVVALRRPQGAVRSPEAWGRRP